MTRRNVLVVLLEDGFESALRQAIAERGNGTPKVHVVAPASVGPLEWLATDEDAARAEASVRGLEAEWSLAESADVGSEPGEADPVQATEDALRSFSADEILVVGGAAEDGGLQRPRFTASASRWSGFADPSRCARETDCASRCAGSRAVEVG